METKEKKESKQVEVVDTNNYKELYGNLRNVISATRDSYKLSLAQTKDVIEQKKEELRLLEIRKHKLEGAIEAHDNLLASALPSNSKKAGQ